MKTVHFILVLGIFGCSNEQLNDSSIDEVDTSELHSNPQLADSSLVNHENVVFQEIVLKENSIDTFSIPFPEKTMLEELKNFYDPYSVESKIGQQDGPDFVFIDVKRQNSSVLFFKFNPDNQFKLDEIISTDSSVVDQYGIRVGSTYEDILKNRTDDFKNSMNYHQHLYLYSESSNIRYELVGHFTMTEEMLDSIENLKLNEQQLKTCRVKKIIWSKDY